MLSLHIPTVNVSFKVDIICKCLNGFVWIEHVLNYSSIVLR